MDRQNLIMRLIVFMENETRSCSMDFGRVTPLYVYRMCAAIDGHGKAELFRRILNEYNEWLLNQQRQQMYIQQFLREYYGA